MNRKIVRIVCIVVVLITLVVVARAVIDSFVSDAPVADQPTLDQPAIERVPEPPAQVTGESKDLPEISATPETRETAVEGGRSGQNGLSGSIPNKPK